MIQGMAKSVSNKEQIYVLVEKADGYSIDYNGCYNNKGETTTKPLGNDVKSQAECQKKFEDSDKGFTHFGLSKGNKCWESKALPSKFNKDSVCNVPCKDDAKLKCGGDYLKV